MIGTIRHKGLKRLYLRNDPSGIGPELVATVRWILTLLDAATTVNAMNIPGLRLHQLKGDMKGIWSVTVDLIEYH